MWSSARIAVSFRFRALSDTRRPGPCFRHAKPLRPRWQAELFCLASQNLEIWRPFLFFAKLCYVLNFGVTFFRAPDGCLSWDLARWRAWWQSRQLLSLDPKMLLIFRIVMSRSRLETENILFAQLEALVVLKGEKLRGICVKININTFLLSLMKNIEQSRIVGSMHLHSGEALAGETSINCFLRHLLYHTLT